MQFTPREIVLMIISFSLGIGTGLGIKFAFKLLCKIFDKYILGNKEG